MTFTYTNAPVLSKVKIGEQYYYLKDADVRAILEAINANVYEKLKLDLGAIKDGNKQNGLAVVSDIKAYVDEMKEIAFDVVKVDAEVVASATAEKYASYHNSIVLVENQEAAAGSCIEYVILRSGEEGSYTYKWEQIGTTKVSLSDYVLKTLTIAGIDLQDNITAAELQAALGLKALAYKDSAKGTISTADSVTVNYTPAGEVNVTLAQTAKEVASTGTFTPAENIVIGSDFSYEINHGLGEIPQYFFLFRDLMYDSINGSTTINCLYMYMCSPTKYYLKSIIGTGTTGTAKVQGTWKNPLATSDVVYIAGYGNADTHLQAGNKHRWIAIGGIV